MLRFVLYFAHLDIEDMAKNTVENTQGNNFTHLYNSFWL